MKKLFVLILLFCSLFSKAQCIVNVQAFDQIGSEEIPRNNVRIYQKGKLIISNEANFNGITRMSIKQNDPIILSVSMLGFQNYDTVLSIKDLDSVSLNVQLQKDWSVFDYRTIYNRQKAIKDMKTGDVKIYFIGLIWNDDLRRINKICRKFGFKYIFTNDCINVEEHLHEAVNSYNKMVLQYLELLNKNNENWKNDLLASTSIDLLTLKNKK